MKIRIHAGINIIHVSSLGSRSSTGRLTPMEVTHTCISKWGNDETDDYNGDNDSDDDYDDDDGNEFFQIHLDRMNHSVVIVLPCVLLMINIIMVRIVHWWLHPRDTMVNNSNLGSAEPYTMHGKSHHRADNGCHHLSRTSWHLYR